MSRLHAGSLDRRLARWLALLALAGLTLTCLGVYTVTALSFEDRQADTLRQKQLQVRHLIAEAGVVGNAALTHKLDDAMVGRQDLTLVLTDAKGQVLYAGPTAPPLRQTLVTRFEAATASGPVQATLTLETTEDDRVLSRLARTLAAATLAGSIIIAVGGFTLVQLGLRPVRNLLYGLAGQDVPEWTAPGAERLQIYLARTVVVSPPGPKDPPITTLIVETPDPDFGTHLLDALHRQADADVRASSLERARQYSAHLAQKLATTEIAEHRRTLSEALLEQERAVMMATSQGPYAALPLEPASGPSKPTSPKPVPALAIGLIAGAILGLLAVAAAHLLANRRRIPGRP